MLGESRQGRAESHERKEDMEILSIVNFITFHWLKKSKLTEHNFTPSERITFWQFYDCLFSVSMVSEVDRKISVCRLYCTKPTDTDIHSRTSTQNIQGID